MDNVSEQDITRAYEVIAFITDKMILETTNEEFKKALQTKDSSKLTVKVRTIYNALFNKQINELHGLLKDEPYKVTMLKEFAEKQRNNNR